MVAKVCLLSVQTFVNSDESSLDAPPFREQKLSRENPSAVFYLADVSIPQGGRLYDACSCCGMRIYKL